MPKPPNPEFMRFLARQSRDEAAWERAEADRSRGWIALAFIAIVSIGLWVIGR